MTCEKHAARPGSRIKDNGATLPAVQEQVRVPLSTDDVRRRILEKKLVNLDEYECWSLGQTEEGRKMALYMASHGCRWSFQQILWMGNPASQEGITIAHHLARKGIRFSFAEVMALGNPATLNTNTTLAHDLASAGQDFSLDELLALGNPATDRGDTLAHFMAEAGHVFSTEELILLGNPANHSGSTVADVMAIRGNGLIPSDIQRLQDPDEREILLRLRRGEALPADCLIRRPDLLARYGL